MTAMEAVLPLTSRRWVFVRRGLWHQCRSWSMRCPQLKLAVAVLEAQPPESTSGIIRLQVPIRQPRDALEWLQAQHQVSSKFLLLQEAQSDFYNPPLWHQQRSKEAAER